MHFFRAVAALGLVPAVGMALLASAFAQTPPQTTPWPSGRAKLAWLEGRWTSSKCGEDFSEYRFTGPNQTGLTYTYGPPAHPVKKRAPARNAVPVVCAIVLVFNINFPPVVAYELVAFSFSFGFVGLTVKIPGRIDLLM